MSKKTFNVKLRNPHYVKGRPGVHTTTLTIEAADRESARAAGLAYAKKHLGVHYVLA